MFSAILIFVVVHLTRVTPQGHGLDQEQVEGHGTFTDHVLSNELSKNEEDKEQDLVLHLLSSASRHGMLPVAKRAPWAPSEVRFDQLIQKLAPSEVRFDQLIQKLRSQAYKNRDKHSSNRRGALDDPHLRRNHRSPVLDDISVDRLSIPADDGVDAWKSQRKIRQRDFSGANDVIVEDPITMKRQKATRESHSIESGVKIGEATRNDQRSYPIYQISGSSDNVEVPALSVLASLLMAADREETTAGISQEIEEILCQMTKYANLFVSCPRLVVVSSGKREFGFRVML